MLKWELDEVDSLQPCPSTGSGRRPSTGSGHDLDDAFRPPEAAQDDALRRAQDDALRRAQDDALPEDTRYRDEGCELFPRCLRCPFPVCRHDDPEWHLKRKADRNAQIRRLRRQGKTIAELAAHFGVSKRTVHRALARKATA